MKTEHSKASITQQHEHKLRSCLVGILLSSLEMIINFNKLSQSSCHVSMAQQYSPLLSR